MLKTDRDKGIVALILIILIGGAMTPFIKISVKEVSPEIFTFFRFLISSILLLPLLLKYRIKINADLLKVIAVSLFGTGNVLLFAYGIKLTTANVGQMLYILTPVLVTLISYLLIKERINFKKATGVAIGFVGGFLLISLPLIEKATSIGTLEGNLLVVLAVLSFSIYSVLSKKVQKNYSPFHMTMIFSITTVILMAFPVMGQISRVPLLLHASQMAIFGILYVGILGTALYYVLYQFAIKHLSPTSTTTAIFYLQPVSTVILSFFLIGESPTVVFFISAIISALGVWLVIKESKQ